MRPSNTPSREPIIKRLRRAEGHLRAINAMFTAQRSTLDIARQLSAVEAAITQAKELLIHDRVQHCIDQRDTTGGALRELTQLTKFL